MRYTRLRSFHAVATAGGFNAAAADLNISQPTLTAQVGALEQEYGVELFMRRGRRSELTDAGRHLLTITTRMFLEEQEAHAYLEQTRELRTGRLTIGAVSPYHVTAMLAAFRSAYPGIELSVALGNTADVLSDLLEYRSDIAVLAYVDPDPRVLTIPHRRHPIVVFARADHRLAGRGRITLRELDGEAMVVREQGSTTRRAFTAALDAAGVKPRIVMEIGSREAVRIAVIHGLGLSYVSDAEFVPDPSLVKIEVQPPEIYTYAQIGVLAARRDSRIIRAFLDVVEDKLGSQASPAATTPPSATSRPSRRGSRARR
jgi:LysR family transcriptional regulator, low CO2-responsive transcriptional regulator